MCHSKNSLEPCADISVTLLPFAPGLAPTTATTATTSDPQLWLQPSTQVVARDPQRVSTGDRGLDLMLTGGAARGSLILFAGTDGIGKSSFCLFAQSMIVAARVLERGIYGCVEESPEMVKLRGMNLGAPMTDDLSFARVRSLEDAQRAISMCQYFVLDSGSELVDQRRLGDMLKVLHASLEAAGTLGIVLMQLNNRGEMAGMRRLRHLADVLLFGEHVDKRGRVLSSRKAIGRVRIVVDGKDRFFNPKRGRPAPREAYYQRDSTHGGRLVFEGTNPISPTLRKRSRKPKPKGQAKRR